jgi:hypothetical protein
MSMLRTTTLVVVPSLLCLALACGSSTDRGGGFDDGTSSGASGTSGATGSSSFGTSGASGASGDGGGNCAAVTAQTAKAKVDIIIVIDNSGSMSGELAQVRTNVNTFASKIGGIGLDYTVTFLVQRGNGSLEVCVPPPLAGAACADKPPQFHHVDMDVQSTDSFRLILSSYETSWKNYLRTDATKVFIEVTDDSSDMPYMQFDTQLLAKQPAGMFGTAAKRNYIWHSIISKPFAATVPSTAICSGAAGSSVDYQHLSVLTGGIIDEVCKTDYSGVLNNIAKGITDKLGCELQYPSSAESDPTKLAVTLTPKGQPAQTLTQVTDVSKCGTIANAWYYDDPVKPTKIILCPSTCTAANGSPDTKLEALVGCKGAPPK